MFALDEWHDYVRVGTILLNMWSCYFLIAKYVQYHKTWNTKTIDLWYALFMWCIAGVALALQAVILDRPFTPGFVILTAAALVTGKGLHKKGVWGGA